MSCKDIVRIIIIPGLRSGRMYPLPFVHYHSSAIPGVELVYGCLFLQWMVVKTSGYSCTHAPSNVEDEIEVCTPAKSHHLSQTINICNYNKNNRSYLTQEIYSDP